MAIERLEGLRWTEQYNCYQTVVGGWLEMSFSWSTDKNKAGYVIRVGGLKLPLTASSAADGAAIAVAQAKAMLSRALEQLQPKL